MSCANAAVAIKPMEQQRQSRERRRSAVGRTIRFAAALKKKDEIVKSRA